MAGIGAAVVFVAAAATTAAILVTAGPSIEDARRECRTAFEREFSERAEAANSGSILVSVTAVELEEARKTDAGFEVNGVVKYDLTGAYLPTTHSTLSLTCVARESGDNLVTTVKNRV